MASSANTTCLTPIAGEKHHLLDVYRPAEGRGPYPAVLYIHGGGFRILSKDSHWGMALAFARRGYVVFVVNYRLAPVHKYPAAVEDVATALQWVNDHAHEYGGDASRLVLAGESAGANLATSLAIALSYRRDEPFARRLFDANIAPRAVIAKCGMLQVSDPERFSRRRKIPRFIRDRILEVSQSYLPKGPVAEGHLDFADPVVVLERSIVPDKPLPPFFSSAGTKDPVLDDTRRLHAALLRLGVRSEARYYQGEIHAFQALHFLPNARAYWQEMHAFLEEVLAR
ncbi:MAG: alpha/beta hydrolase fold domain-containing protein [Polyangiaceae bacterium]|nr:alpha/beta hydrolase fold domain-containing protein [Polyangiaceae bacterium]